MPVKARTSSASPRIREEICAIQMVIPGVVAGTHLRVVPSGQPTAEEFFQEIAVDAAKLWGTGSTYRFIFRATQWLWTMGFSIWDSSLTAVAAPITYAISLMPTKRHFLFDLNLFSP